MVRYSQCPAESTPYIVLPHRFDEGEALSKGRFFVIMS